MYMKQIIRKILKEDNRHRYYDILLGKANENLWSYNFNPIKTYAMSDEDINHFERVSISKFKELEGLDYNVNDYPISAGSYDFDFKIDTIKSDSEFKDINGYMDIYIYYVLGKGYMDDMDGETFTLNDALDNSQYGWEVSNEVSDIVASIVRYLVPETKLTTMSINATLV